jgi:anti-anti-sigma factor
MQAFPKQSPYSRYVRKLVLSGRLDVHSVAQLEARFFASAVVPGKPVVIDLRGVEQLTCMVVGLLMSIARALGRRKVPMVVISSEPVLGFEWSAARDLISVVPSEREALARLNS